MCILPSTHLKDAVNSRQWMSIKVDKRDRERKGYLNARRFFSMNVDLKKTF